MTDLSGGRRGQENVVGSSGDDSVALIETGDDTYVVAVSQSQLHDPPFEVLVIEDHEDHVHAGLFQNRRRRDREVRLGALPVDEGSKAGSDPGRRRRRGHLDDHRGRAGGGVDHLSEADQAAVFAEHDLVSGTLTLEGKPESSRFIDLQEVGLSDPRLQPEGVAVDDLHQGLPGGHKAPIEERALHHDAGDGAANRETPGGGPAAGGPDLLAALAGAVELDLGQGQIAFGVRQGPGGHGAGLHEGSGPFQLPLGAGELGLSGLYIAGDAGHLARVDTGCDVGQDLAGLYGFADLEDSPRGGTDFAVEGGCDPGLSTGGGRDPGVDRSGGPQGPELWLDDFKAHFLLILGREMDFAVAVVVIAVTVVVIAVAVAVVAVAVAVVTVAVAVVTVAVAVVTVAVVMVAVVMVAVAVVMITVAMVVTVAVVMVAVAMVMVMVAVAVVAVAVAVVMGVTVVIMGLTTGHGEDQNQE